MSSEVRTVTFKSQSGLVRMGLLAVLAAAYICYAAALQFAFVYDDVPQIVNNPRIKSVHFLPDYFVRHVWAQQPGQPQNLYRPLFLVWLLGNFEAFGLESAYWHLAAVLLNCLMVFMVYLLARKLLLEKPWAALLATGLFAAHPAHVEAVAWISGATEPLVGIFFAAAFLCYLRTQEQPQRRVLWAAVSFVCTVAAILTKETAVVLPVVILCYQWIMRPGQKDAAQDSSQWRSLVLAGWPYAILLGGYFALRSVALHGVAHSFSDVPVWKSVLSLPWVVYFYLSQLLFPAGFGPYYDVEYASAFNLVMPLLVLAGVAAGIWWWSRKSASRLPLFLASWFLLTLAPALALFTVVWRYDNLHDRYLYLPSIAIAILAGHIAGNAAERLPASRQKWTWGVSLAVVALLFVAAYRQTFYWKDNLTLYVRGTAVAPHNIVAKLNLAAAFFERHDYDDALAVSQQALKVDPNSRVALTNVAEGLYFHGDYAASEHYYSQLLAVGTPSVDQIYYFSLAKIKLGKYKEALSLLHTGLIYWPDAPGYHSAMGQALSAMGQWPAARDEYKLELQQNPANLEVQRKLADAETHLRPAGD